MTLGLLKMAGFGIFLLCLKIFMLLFKLRSSLFFLFEKSKKLCYNIYKRMEEN